MSPQLHKHLIPVLFLLSATPLNAHPGHFPDSVHDNSTHSVEQHLIKTYQAELEKSPDDVRLLMQLGRAYLDAGRRSGLHKPFAQALEAFQKGLTLSPGEPALLEASAQAKLGVHQFASALEDIRAAMQSRPQEKSLQYLQADCLLALGRYTNAAEILRSLYSPEDITVENAARMAQLEEARGRFTAALEYYHEAHQAGLLLEAPKQQIAWCITMKADLQRLRFHNPSVSLELLMEALALDPTSPEILYRLALTRLDLRGSQNAVQARELLISLTNNHPEHARYWEALSLAQQKLGEFEASNSSAAKAEQIWEAEYSTGEYGHIREYAWFLIRHKNNPEKALQLALLDLEHIRQDTEAYELAIAAASALEKRDLAIELEQKRQAAIQF